MLWDYKYLRVRGSPKRFTLSRLLNIDFYILGFIVFLNRISNKNRFLACSKHSNSILFIRFTGFKPNISLPFSSSTASGPYNFSLRRCLNVSERVSERLFGIPPAVVDHHLCIDRNSLNIRVGYYVTTGDGQSAP
jgi:hypothetical protein